MKMQNKVALVMGAALGSKESRPTIGDPIARKLASQGVRTVLFPACDDSSFVKASASSSTAAVRSVRCLQRSGAGRRSGVRWGLRYPTTNPAWGDSDLSDRAQRRGDR